MAEPDSPRTERTEAPPEGADGDATPATQLPKKGGISLGGLKRSSSHVAAVLGKSLQSYNKERSSVGPLGTRRKLKQSGWRAFVGNLIGRCGCCQSAEGAVPPAVSLMTDVEDLKQNVRARMSKHTYSVKDHYKTEGICQKIARSNWFENLTLTIIAVNSLWIWIDTDNNDASIITEAKVEFQIAENLFCTFFTFEWLVRLFAFQRKVLALTDAWFVLDTLLVSLMIVETWITPLVLSILQISSDGMGDATILRLVRLLRLARMTRVAKLLRAFPEVLIMIKGISAAGRSVAFTICLLILVLYVFGIAFKQICDGLPIGTNSFSTVPESMLTLLIHGVFMDDMAELVAAIREDSAVAFGTFIIFVLIASITLMNMLIGVLCEVVSMVGQSEREELLVEFVKRELMDIIIEADEDGDGLMSHQEFLRILESPEGLRALETVGVDPVGLIDYADTIFAQDDGDVGETVLFSHFMSEILQLRGSNTATVKDLISMRKFVEKMNKEVRKDLNEVNRHVLQLAEVVKEIRSPAIGTVLQTATVTPEAEVPRNGPPQGAQMAMAKPTPEIPPMAGEKQRDVSPVPLRAHMQANPVRKTPPNYHSQRAQAQNLGHEGAQSHAAGSKRFPELDGSLPQKLQEMQDILGELMAGPYAVGPGMVEDLGDAARPGGRGGEDGMQNLRRLGRGDRGSPRQERISPRDSRGRSHGPQGVPVVQGRPVPTEEIPRGRMVQATRLQRRLSHASDPRSEVEV